jgi:dimethylglycine dehydrogenase
VFGVANGWEVPNWFAPEGIEPVDRPGFGRANWFSHVGAECQAVQNAAGLFDVSSLAKFEIAGPDAAGLLAKLSANRIPNIGERSEAAFLAPSGGIAFWVSVHRLDHERFLITAHAAAEQLLEDYLRDHGPAMTVAIANVTSANGALLLAGAAASGILDSAVGRQVSGAEVNRPLAATIDLAPVWIVRVDDVAESAWEIHCACECLLDVYEALWNRGRSRGLEACGRRAYDSLRLEKGIPRWGVDFSIETSPEAAGLLIDDSHTGTHPIAGPWQRNATRLVHLCLDDGCAVAPWGGEVVEINGTPVGAVTSGAYGHRLGKSLAFARVSPAHATPGTRLRVVLLGEQYGATVMPSTRTQGARGKS